jgi:dnd system-associated protein 4
MARAQLFSKDRLVYWPSEFVSVANFLKGQNDKGHGVSSPLFSFNTGIMVLGAAMGVQQRRKREVGKEKQEIMTSTFASHGLDGYILLIPLLGNSSAGVDALRPENEEELIREFERYAAGGLEILRGLFDESAGKSAELVLQKEMLRLLNQGEKNSSTDAIKLF